MEELIKLYDYPKWNQKVIDGRDLHKFLESKQEYTAWMKSRIKKYKFIDDQDFTSFDKVIKRTKGATTRKQYALILDMAKEVCMIENNEKGRQARKYFIEMEKVAIESIKQRSIPAVSASRKQLAQMILDIEDEKEVLEEKIKSDAPKVLYAETVTKLEAGDVLVNKLAKMISNSSHVTIGQNNLYKWLRENEFCYKRGKVNIPFQWAVDKGYFKFIERVVGENKDIRTHTIYVTGLGCIHITDKYMKSQGITPLFSIL